MYETKVLTAKQANKFWRLFQKAFPNKDCEINTIGCAKFYIHCADIETQDEKGQCLKIEEEI